MSLFFNFILCNFSVWTLQYFFKKIWKKICPQNLKKLPSKVAHNPTRLQVFSPEQVFGLCNWNSFLVCFFLIFEFVKLFRMNLECPDSTYEIPHSKPLICLLLETGLS